MATAIEYGLIAAIVAVGGIAIASSYGDKTTPPVTTTAQAVTKSSTGPASHEVDFYKALAPCGHKVVSVTIVHGRLILATRPVNPGEKPVSISVTTLAMGGAVGGKQNVEVHERAPCVTSPKPKRIVQQLF